MGFFFTDDNIESAESKKRNREEIENYAEESLELVKNVPDENFPDFLWEPLINDFGGEDYRIKGACEDPAVLRAYTIGRKYSDYWDYMDAIDAYMAYVEYVDDLYGSFEMMAESEMIFIPKRPKLMNKKQNKKLLRTGFIPSRLDEEYDLDEDVFKSIVETIPLKDIDERENLPLSKTQKRILENMIANKEKADRLNSIYSFGSSVKSGSGIDAIINFLTNPDKDDVKKMKYSSFFDNIVNAHEYDYIPEDVLDDDILPKEAIIRDGLLVDSVKNRQLKIIEELVKNGYSFLSAASTVGLDNKSVRMITKKYGLDKDISELTPKQLKKLKKKQAKEKKMAADKRIGDKRLQDALLRNRITVSGNDFVNFRLADVIPDSDDDD